MSLERWIRLIADAFVIMKESLFPNGGANAVRHGRTPKGALT